jgi:exodeoxyribonuclease VIII
MEKLIYSDGVHDISNEQYHSSSAISRSMLMELKKSPYHYHKKYHNPDYIKTEPTSSLIMGDLVHSLILEPTKADERYIIKPSFDRRTKVGKILYDQFLCMVQGRTIIDQEMFNEAHKIALAFRDNSLAQAILDGSKVEQSIYFTHQETGLQCKVRPDIWNNTLVSDLKTTNDASYDKFQRSASKYGYFIQAGMIYEALKSINIIMEKFIFIVVEKEFPNAIAIYELDEECIEFGIQQFNLLMRQLIECKIKESFPSYPYTKLFLPTYSQYEQIGEIQHD